jgi:Uncharacterized alpha/beta hydrolase domain (DUF2235)
LVSGRQRDRRDLHNYAAIPSRPYFRYTRSGSTRGTPMRNIVICCDGTGNEISENISNVLKLYRCLRKTGKTTPRQLTRGVSVAMQPEGGSLCSLQ